MASAIAVFALLAGANTASAATVPSGSVVRVRGAIDLEAFARAIASRYAVVLHRVVAADIDRDGDLDVLATSDRDVLVWVNDGHGRLTSAPSTAAPAIDRSATGDTWRLAGTPRDESIQNEAPSPRLCPVSTHAPPPTAGLTVRGVRGRRLADAGPNAASPRAPPPAFPAP